MGLSLEDRVWCYGTTTLGGLVLGLLVGHGAGAIIGGLVGIGLGVASSRMKR